MSTRGLFTIKNEGSCFIRCDAYPDGFGRTLVEFLAQTNQPYEDHRTRLLSYIQFVDEIDKSDDRLIDDVLTEVVEWDETKPPVKPWLSTDDAAFESDGLFCEWVYELDWAKNRLVVKGRRGFTIDLATIPKTNVGTWWRDIVQTYTS